MTVAETSTCSARNLLLCSGEDAAIMHMVAICPLVMEKTRRMKRYKTSELMIAFEGANREIARGDRLTLHARKIGMKRTRKAAMTKSFCPDHTRKSGLESKDVPR